ncbi:PREDICTED: F-box protein At3g62230-like [Camelina sativa]|uniref:F-box protein At3g62230-like n=1 Tax=Camelina sativa TaxID=90675 RepID=A0ABM0WPY2_CAMSA|nr:PREDICTED: F-box protein At3g62230-like [Camelina sativa]
MDSTRNQDKISSLPDFILVLIISTLPLNEAVKTSVLSKRWKNLYRKSITNDIVFKESDFVTCYASNDEETKRVTRVSFICFMLGWVLRLSGKAIESLDLSISKLMGFETHLNSLMEFAVSKQIKNLVLDFSDPSWTTNNEASVVQLPECVYNLINLESLKLFACGFDPSRLTNPGSLKVLCFGWIQLKEIMSLISTTPMLESLSIQNCWDVGLEMITEYNNRLRELVFENCGFSVPYSTLELPNILIFKYSGKVHYFQFLSVNRC